MVFLQKAHSFFLAKDLIRSMLSVDSEERPTVEQVLAHAWLSNQKETLGKLYAKVKMVFMLLIK
jgi:hypothetical protein